MYSPPQLHLRWLPIMPGCCDSYAVYDLLFLLSSKVQCLVCEMSWARWRCASVPLLLQYLEIWNEGWNLNRRHKFCHCSSFWLLSAHFTRHCRLSLSYCSETYNFSPEQTWDNCLLSLSEKLDSCILSRLFSKVASGRKLDLVPITPYDVKAELSL